MTRYRKQPVEIEAAQWDGAPGSASEIIDWILKAGTQSARYHHHPPAIAIDTLEGVVRASPGDVIIQGVQGEFYPCKPDIFAATYELVED